MADDNERVEEIDLEEHRDEIEALAAKAEDLAGQAEALEASQRDADERDVRQSQRRIKSAGYRIKRIREADVASSGGRSRCSTI